MNARLTAVAGLGVSRVERADPSAKRNRSLGLSLLNAGAADFTPAPVRHRRLGVDRRTRLRVDHGEPRSPLQVGDEGRAELGIVGQTDLIGGVEEELHPMREALAPYLDFPTLRRLAAAGEDFAQAYIGTGEMPPEVQALLDMLGLLLRPTRASQKPCRYCRGVYA